MLDSETAELEAVMVESSSLYLWVIDNTLDFLKAAG